MSYGSDDVVPCFCSMVASPFDEAQPNGTLSGKLLGLSPSFVLTKLESSFGPP